jgi:hypothetical protein
MSSATIEVPNFDTVPLKTACCIAVHGWPGTGKTTHIVHLLRRMRREGPAVAECIVFTAASYSNTSQYSKEVKREHLVTASYAARLQDIWAAHKHSVSTAVMADKPPPRLVLILDDIVYDTRFAKSTALKELLLNHRHYNISVLMSLQYRSLHKMLMDQIDYTLVVGQKSEEDIIANFCPEESEALQSRLAGNESEIDWLRCNLWPAASSNVFKTVLEACTQDYEALVISRTRKLYWCSNQDSGKEKVKDAIKSLTGQMSKL